MCNNIFSSQKMNVKKLENKNTKNKWNMEIEMWTLYFIIRYLIVQAYRKLSKNHLFIYINGSFNIVDH